MAGMPLRRACIRALDEHEEEIFDRLAAGEFVTALCRDYLAGPYDEAGNDLPANAGNYHFYKWLDEEDGRRERFERTRSAAADAVAEESIQILDEAREEGVASTAEATLARAQSNSRQWWAAKLNREKYGEGRQAIDVNVGIQELHLDALRKSGSMKAVRDQQEEPAGVIEGEYEIEDGSSAQEKYGRTGLGDLPEDD